MKLHTNIPDYYSCGSVVIGLITGKDPCDIQQSLIRYRRKNPPKANEFCFQLRDLSNANNTYWNELRYFLRKRIGKHRTVEMWNKPAIKLGDWVYSVDPNNWYLVMTSDHVQIVHNRKSWDTAAIQGMPVNQHKWNKRKVICYIQMKG